MYLCRYICMCFMLWLLIIQVNSMKCANNEPPNIIYILADDMGWNDVGFHGSDQIPTSNIDSLAYHGVILNRHYVQPLCTPSRASLMTGKYPLYTGIHNALSPSHKVGLPLSEKIMPQYFKDAGYSTHLIGKWHLGFYQREFTPLARGFDSHFGYWSGAISYYDHVDEDPIPEGENLAGISGHDFRRNYTPAWDVVGEYATDIFTDEAVKLIENHPTDKPILLYLAHLAVHAGNQGKWLEAPQEEINRFSYISNPNRRSYAAMVSKLDQSVGRVVDALDRKNMLKNSIIVFVSDNGAPNVGVYPNWGSNYPWRGQKASLWEGGVRTPSLIWSPLINNPSRVSNTLMHMTDWLPTLLNAACSNVELKNINGVNQWQAISRGFLGPREGLIVDIDKEQDMYSVLMNYFKYIKGPNPPRSPPDINGYLNFDTITSRREPKYDIDGITKSPAWQAVHKFSRDPNLRHKVKELRQDAKVVCYHDFNKAANCTDEPCLFNLQTDPCEQNNLARVFPTLLDHIENIIEVYKNKGVPSIPLIKDPASNPKFYNGSWSIWVT